MSLDVTLHTVKVIEVCDVYDANITHNLSTMARAAGIYQHLWRPHDIGIYRAGDLVEPLREGLAKLEADPEKFKQYEPENRWGTYKDFVPWIREYLEACEANPDAIITVFR